MEDIVSTIPYQCDDPDCPHEWHLAHYWVYGDGTYSVCDSDGNHEACEEPEVPDAAREHKAWSQYARHVLAAGADPLGNYLVPHTVKRTERWSLQFSRSVLGILLVGARRGRGGQWIGPAGIPDHVAQFAGVKPQHIAKRTGPLVTDFEEMPEEVNRAHRWNGTIDNETPRAPHLIARDLRRAARRHLARKP